MLSQPELVTFGGGPGSLDPAAAYLDGASMHESCAVAGEGARKWTASVWMHQNKIKTLIQLKFLKKKGNYFCSFTCS